MIIIFKFYCDINLSLNTPSMLRLFLFSDHFPAIGKWIKRQFQFFLSWLLHLPRFYKKPKILFFGSLDTVIIKNGVLVLSWKTKDAWKVKIQGVGKFVFRSSINISPDFDKKNFTLTACGYWRKLRSEITIQTLPPLNLQKVIVVIPQKKIKAFIKNVSIKRDKQLGSTNLEKILAIKNNLLGVSITEIKIIIPPFENNNDQHNQPKLLNSPS
jgi:hypothetical protein